MSLTVRKVVNDSIKKQIESLKKSLDYLERAKYVGNINQKVKYMEQARNKVDSATFLNKLTQDYVKQKGE